MNRQVMDRQQKRMGRQQGAALIVAMILLLLLTLLGTDSMRTSMLDMHLSKGFLDQNNAFQSAETGLRLAEELLQSAETSEALSSLLSGANIGYENDIVDYSDDSYWDEQSHYSDDYPVKVVVKKWRDVWDNLDVGTGEEKGRTTYYRVTARGTDPAYQHFLNAGNSEEYKKVRSLVVLQSVYVVRHTN